jgi:hypothetical protein
MKKTILNLRGFQQLTRNEQKTINAGKVLNADACDLKLCPKGTWCVVDYLSNVGICVC